MIVTLHDALKADVVFVGVKLLKTPEEIRLFRDRVGFDFQVRSGTAAAGQTGEIPSHSRGYFCNAKGSP